MVDCGQRDTLVFTIGQQEKLYGIIKSNEISSASLMLFIDVAVLGGVLQGGFGKRCVSFGCCHLPNRILSWWKAAKAI